MLQKLLQHTDIDIGHGARRKIIFADKRFHQHWRAKHFVELKMLRPLRADSNQCIGKYRERLVRVAFDATIEPMRIGLAASIRLVVSFMAADALKVFLNLAHVIFGIPSLHYLLFLFERITTGQTPQDRVIDILESEWPDGCSNVFRDPPSAIVDQTHLHAECAKASMHSIT